MSKEAAVKSTYTATCVCGDVVSAKTQEKLSLLMGDHHSQKRHVGPPSFHLSVDDATQAVYDREHARAMKTGEALSQLRSSDVWVVRAMEDGTALSPARKKHRAKLRQIIADLATADDPASIVIPAPPAK